MAINPTCKRCDRPYIYEPGADEFSTGLCYHCFEDAIEEYEEKRRERIALENEY